MSVARTLVLSAVVSFGLTSFTIPSAFAEDLVQADVANSPQSAAGLINSNDVFVRTTYSEQQYPTMKLQKGATVTVIGKKNNWLKIVPPEGSFCYISKAYVAKRDDGTVGRVIKKDGAPARWGSSLNTMKFSLAAKLDPEDDVTILGEEDEYFKIAPPPGAALFVDLKYVDYLKTLAPAAKTQVENPTPSVVQNPVQTPEVTDTTGHTTEVGPVAIIDEGTSATTKPSVASTDTHAPASTQPTETAEVKFDELEAQFAALNAKPIEEQQLADLLTGYEALATSNKLPGSMSRIVGLRVSTLKVRMEAREQYLATMKSQQETTQQQVALAAERQELQERIKQADVQVYSAVGKLQTSSLQQGRETLYRLTDPLNGHTVVYIRTSDKDVLAMLGQFVGVRGDIVNEDRGNLRTITPTEVKIVDPTQVGTNVSADLIPSSLIKKAEAASVEQ